MKYEQPTNREITTGSVLTAYSAVSALLLLAAAIALFEAAVAIRKKLTQCLGQDDDDRNRLNNNEQSFDKKTTLSSCCLKYKKRERLPVQKHQHRRFSIQPQRLGSPQISVTSSKESYDTSNADSLSSTYQTVYKPCEITTNFDDNSQWFPVSRLKHMGAPLFNNPSRRVSSPDWSGRIAWKGSRPSVASVETQLSLTDRLARRSFAGQSALTTLPLTPGVARLSNSLLDCYDGQSDMTQLNKVADNACPASLELQDSPKTLSCHERMDALNSGVGVKSTIASPYYRPELQRFSIQETRLIFGKN